MKKLIMLLLTLVLLVQTTTLGQAATKDIPVTLCFNGQFVTTEVAPYTQNGVTYIPLRSLTNLLGIKDILRDPEENSVAFDYENKSIKFFLDQNKVLVNGHEYTINGTATVVEGVTMVPLEFLAENLECTMRWDEFTKFVYLTKDGVTVKKNYSGYTSEDVLWLARIIQVEGYDTSFECKLAIANVVLNRTKSGIYPGTIYGVIFQAGRFPQFPPAHKDGFKELTPFEVNIAVAKRALNGENNISKCLYFNNSPFRTKSDDLYKIIDGEYFYY